MRLQHVIGLGLLALAPVGAMAASPIGNNLDAYYISSGIETGAGDDDGDGFGAKGRFAFADTLFFSGEYQSSNYDDSDSDLNQLRLGVGFNSSISPQATLYGLAEFIQAEPDNTGIPSFDEAQNGLGVHGGIQFNLGDDVSLDGRLGYVDIGDLGDGVEFLVGATYRLTPAFGIFADYRVTQIDGDFGDIDVDDFRAGLRFAF